jgi:MoxR-like ATPase
MGYPDHASEVEILRGRAAGRTIEEIAPVMDVNTVRQMIDIARRVFVSASLFDYVVNICQMTREMPEVRLGVSPRGSLALIQAAQSLAASRARDFVVADDLKILTPYVLGHRLLLTTEAELAGRSTVALLGEVLSAVPVPEERVGA